MAPPDGHAILSRYRTRQCGGSVEVPSSARKRTTSTGSVLAHNEAMTAARTRLPPAALCRTRWVAAPLPPVFPTIKRSDRSRHPKGEGPGSAEDKVDAFRGAVHANGATQGGCAT